MCCFFIGTNLYDSSNERINIIKKLSGSSYLLEIDKLTEEYDNLIIILDNNHQIDALYNELKSLFKEKIF